MYWCWSWSPNTLATWCQEPTHWKRPWCRERLRAGEGDDRGWDGWMASPTQWTWLWANSGRQWRTGKPGVLQSMGLQRGGSSWMTINHLEPKDDISDWVWITGVTGHGKMMEWVGHWSVGCHRTSSYLPMPEAASEPRPQFPGTFTVKEF